MSEPGDVILAATLPELSFTATAIPSAHAALNGTLPALVFAAQAVPMTEAALMGTFPPLAMVAEARYQSYAVRPVTGQSVSRWQRALEHSAGVEDRREATAHEHAPTHAPWQAADPQGVGVAFRRHSTRTRAPVSSRSRYQEAVPVQTGGRASHADAIRLRTARTSAFEEAVRAEWLRWAIGHQDTWRDRRFAAISRYQEARRHGGHFHGEGIRSASYLRRWWASLWQAAMRPLPGRHPPVPFVPPEEPACYLPNAHLLFTEDVATNGDLLFVCEHHDYPEAGSVLVPNRRVYFVINEVTLTRWPDGTPVPVLGLSLSLDTDSWAWGFDATLPVTAESLVVPEEGAAPVELIATVNGTTFHVLAENLSRERVFGDASIRITGRGRSATLAAPYAPVMNFANTEARSAQQLMEDVLTINGIPLGWTVDWALTDWLVPAGVFAKQWQERLQAFLEVGGDVVGTIGGGTSIPTGKIDIAVMQSLSRRGEVNALVENYGQVMVDECHHVGAVSFDAILKRARSRFVLGLTATPIRRDGQQPIIFMQCGPIRHTAAMPAGAPHVLQVQPHVRLMRIDLPAYAGIQEVFRHLAEDTGRTQAIATVVREAVGQGRKVLVLTERTEHLDAIAAALDGLTPKPFTLHGRMSRKQRAALMADLEALAPDAPRVLLSTGKLVGEGFDHPPLDTLVLAMPVSWKGTLQQYAGRPHRTHAGKTDVRIVDFVDTGHPALLKMWEKRQRGYRAMGYRMGIEDSAG